MLNVQVDRKLSQKLNKASARKRCYPWDPSTIDWSVAIDNQHLYVPEQFSLFALTPAWSRLDMGQKSYLTRYEFTQNMRNAGAGEHLLIQALMSLLHHTDQYDPAWRYLLHEVAEECQHMAMFNSWIQLNPDIRTKGLNDDKWGLLASTLTPLVAVNFPMLLWTLTLLLELVGDTLQKTQDANEDALLHPIPRQIAQAHEIEEARHIAFARAWLSEGVPKMKKAQRWQLTLVCETAIANIVKVGVNPFYSGQIKQLVSFKDYTIAVKHPQRKEVWQESVKPTVDFLNDIGLVRTKTLKKWHKKGVLRKSLN